LTKSRERLDDNMSKELEVGLDILPPKASGVYAGGVSVMWADDPRQGRFRIAGIVLGGLKSVLYRKVEILMTYREAQTLRDELNHWLEIYPNTGTEPDTHVGGSIRART
jgi:hypothetical protein